MAQKSNIQFCLVWETERPYHGRPRNSSYFRMLGKEWFLDISIPGDWQNSCYIGYVRLHQRSDSCYIGHVRLPKRSKKTPKTDCSILASCNVITSTKLLHSPDGNNPVTVRQSGAVLYKFGYPSDEFKDETSETWKVFCQLSSCEALSLQINNETIQLSTVDDKNLPPTSTEKWVRILPGIPLDSETLSLDISRMLKQEVLPDFKLRCGGRTFPVHRSVLSVRSEVFATMFQNTIQKSETESIDIKDLEVPILDLLLKFVYSGKLEDISEGTAACLYEAADVYAVHRLRSACSSWMIQNQTEENCLRYLLAADSRSDPDLKSAAVSFIAKHPVVLKSAAWSALSKKHPVLAVEVFSTYVSSTSQ